MISDNYFCTVLEELKIVKSLRSNEQHKESTALTVYHYCTPILSTLHYIVYRRHSLQLR